MLLKVARAHARELATTLHQARQVLGETHPNVGRLTREARLADDAVRALETEPEKVAA
jgi:hypothetical protein